MPGGLFLLKNDELEGRVVEGDIARLRSKGAPEGRRLAGEYLKTLEAI
jgi:hypothetical protein